jgi:tight adherence protein B
MQIGTQTVDPMVLLLMGGAVVLFFGAMIVFIVVSRARNRVKARMTRINQRYTGRIPKEARSVSVKRNTSTSSIAGLDKALQKIIPRPAILRERLEKTGKSISIGEYALSNVLVAAVVTYCVHRFIGLPWAPSILAGLACGVGLPHFVVSRLIKKRLVKFTHLFPEAIELIVRGLKSGLPVQESIQVVGNEIEDPVGVEFREISDALKIGQTMEEAMWEASHRLDTPEFKFFVISLVIQRETGGNLTETLGNLSDILRKRRQMKLKVKAMSSEARASALIIGALPFVMFGILFMLNPGYASQLFKETRGLMLLGAGGLSMSIGFLVMGKMIRFEV